MRVVQKNLHSKNDLKHLIFSLSHPFYAIVIIVGQSDHVLIQSEDFKILNKLEFLSSKTPFVGTLNLHPNTPEQL